MKYAAATLTAVAAMAASVQAASIPVQVGANGLVFTPDTVTAAMGDTVVFTYSGDIHSVVESAGTSTTTACEPLANGFATGIMSSGTTYSLPINSSDPVYIHCGPHCTVGMVMIINPPSSTSFTTFQNAAEGMATASSSSSSGASSSSSSAAASATSSSKDSASSLSTSNYAAVAALAAALLGVVAVM